MQKITPCLWFSDNAEEAANFYTGIFKDAKIKHTTYYGEGGPGKPGSVMTVTFELLGQEYYALNGGADFPFSWAISMMVNCETQQELDNYWEKLLEGGHAEQCGWLKDKFGLSWQIVPANLHALMSGTQKQSDAVMAAVMKMVKLDIATMQKAFDDAA